MNIEKLKYPIGPFQNPSSIDGAQLSKWILSIKSLPDSLRKITTTLKDEQWSLQYRPESWNVRQIVHHLADSHINSYCRFKLALTEKDASIKPYDENLWAELPDAKDGDPNYSIDLLSGLHYRWSTLLETLSPEQLKKTFYHPEHEKHFYLDETIANYAWHSDHHLAQIEQAIRLNGNFNLS